MSRWSVGVGRLFGIPIRVHVVLLVWVAFRLLGALGEDHPSRAFQIELAVCLGLAGIVLLHEFGHAFAAIQQGGVAEEVLLWPLGGLAFTARTPHRPWAEFVTVVWGPLVNVLLAAISAPLFFLWAGAFTPHLFDIYSLTSFVQDSPALLEDLRAAAAANGGEWPLVYVIPDYLFKTNLVLLVFNLFPAYPMDSGRLVQCALWARGNYRRSVMQATALSFVLSPALVVAGLFWGEGNFLIALIGVWNILECIQERRRLRMEGDDTFLGYDFSMGHAALDAPPPRPGFFERRRVKREARRRAREARRAQELRARVDQLLEKVHREGLPALTDEERDFLKQASRKY
ncbi:MAG: hypothetical protein HY719_04510 [Planctomycetes bacterium]|nr:hypothetical protein [Planctomycetota bacterium]